MGNEDSSQTRDIKYDKNNPDEHKVNFKMKDWQKNASPLLS